MCSIMVHEYRFCSDGFLLVLTECLNHCFYICFCSGILVSLAETNKRKIKRDYLYFYDTCSKKIFTSWIHNYNQLSSKKPLIYSKIVPLKIMIIILEF